MFEAWSRFASYERGWRTFLPNVADKIHMARVHGFSDSVMVEHQSMILLASGHEKPIRFSKIVTSLKFLGHGTANQLHLARVPRRTNVKLVKKDSTNLR